MRSDAALGEPDAFADPEVAEAFGTVLEAVSPTVVHIHSIQGLGALVVDACAERGVPSAVTLHDAWWLCERQFMVTGEDAYCNQTRIDPRICATCVVNADYNSERTTVLRSSLAKADLLITPSRFARDLYLANGVAPDRIVVNGNGVVKPPHDFRRTESKIIRFGYVGGVTPIKGYDLVIEAFSGIHDDAVELTIVDNTINLGHASVTLGEDRIGTRLRIVPAYNQAGLDAFFGELDVLLFPTRWKETFGLTVREASARDVWVIASDAGGVPEDVVNGENGYVIPFPPTVDTLRDAVLKTIARFRESGPFHNPYKDRIRGFDEQAAELRMLLDGIALKDD